MYALTIAISAGVRVRFGIFGCELVKKTRLAVAVIPGVLAMSRNAGLMSILLGALGCRSTIWQPLQASRANALSPSCAFALNKAAARTAPTTATRAARHTAILLSQVAPS